MDLSLLHAVDAVDATALLWWVFLLIVWRLATRLAGYRGITTFTLFLPYSFLTNGVLVPVANDVTYELTGIDLALRSYDQYWYSLALMYCALLVGIVLANQLRSRAVPQYSVGDTCDVVGHPSGVRWYVGIVMVLSVVSLIQIYGAGLAFDLPSYLTMRMDYSAYEAHRYGFADATRGFEYFLYNKLPYGIAPVAVIIVWNARGLATWKRVAFIGVLAFALLQTGHKMPIVSLLAYMVISRATIRRRLTLGARTGAIAVAVLLVVVFVILPAFYLMQGNDTYQDSLFWSVERVFLENSRVLQMHFEVYPALHPFLHGASTGTIASLMGVSDYVTPSVYIPRELMGLENTSFPALFIGEAWADFGYVGVGLASVLVGFILQLYNIWFYSRRAHGLEEVALFLSIVLGAYHLFESNLLTSFLSFGIVSNFVIYRLIRGRHEARHKVHSDGV